MLEVMAVYALTQQNRSLYNGGFFDQMFEVIAVYTAAVIPMGSPSCGGDVAVYV